MGMLSGLVAERRAHPDERREDVLGNLCFAHRGDEELSDTEVVVHTFQLIVAATHTTRSLIANCLYQLLAEHELWDWVLAERSLLLQAIEESLRLDSPATFLVRTAFEEEEILACPVTVGDKQCLSFPSADRDESAGVIARSTSCCPVPTSWNTWSSAEALTPALVRRWPDGSHRGY